MLSKFQIPALICGWEHFAFFSVAAALSTDPCGSCRHKKDRKGIHSHICTIPEVKFLKGIIHLTLVESTATVPNPTKHFLLNANFATATLLGSRPDLT